MTNPATDVVRLVELSHVVEHGMITYPGLPGPVVEVHLSRQDSRALYAPGTEFEIGRISMVANTGTYLDAPSHRYPAGDDLSQVPLHLVAALPGVALDVRATGRAVTAAVLAELTAPAGPGEAAAGGLAGRAVLLRTGWSRHWRTPEYVVEAPYVSRDGAQWLVDAGVTLVGIDSVNIDDMADPTRPAHTVLLGAGRPVLEHLTGLEQLPPSGFTLHAAPVRVAGMGTFPVRAYAVLA